jgi:hypothetical protein
MDYPLSFFAQYHPLSPELSVELRARLRRIEPTKNNTLLINGDSCHNLYFIEKGILVCYDWEGKKKFCSWLIGPGNVATAVASFYQQTVSKESIIAVTPSIVWLLNKWDFDYLTSRFSEFRTIRQAIAEKCLVESRVMDAQRRRPPEDFYKFLKRSYPVIVRQVPRTILASWMGISRETLYSVLNRIGSTSKTFASTI